VRLLTIQGL